MLNNIDFLIKERFGIGLMSDYELRKRFEKLAINKKYLDCIKYSNYKESKNGMFGVIIYKHIESTKVDEFYNRDFIILLKEKREVLWIEECYDINYEYVEVSNNGTVLFITGYSDEQKKEIFEEVMKNKNTIKDEQPEYNAICLLLNDKSYYKEGNYISIPGKFVNIKNADSLLLLKYELKYGVTAIAISDDNKFFVCSTGFSDNNIYIFTEKGLLKIIPNKERKVREAINFLLFENKKLLVYSGNSLITSKFSYSIEI